MFLFLNRKFRCDPLLELFQYMFMLKYGTSSLNYSFYPYHLEHCQNHEDIMVKDNSKAVLANQLPQIIDQHCLSSSL